MQTIWIMAGEESGDQYGARLARELFQLAPDTVLRGMGGHAMAAAGVEILADSTELGIIGFVEVIRHLPVLLRTFRGLIRLAEAERPDAVVLIDYPGFNLRFAKKLHGLGIPAIYYVSPQIWAWKKGRLPKMSVWLRKVLCIFPFEPAVYAGSGLAAEFVGHPLVEMLRECPDGASERDPDLILLLPGSRRGEIERLLEGILLTARELKRRRPAATFVMPLPRPRIVDCVRARMQALELPEDMPEIHLEVGTARSRMQRAGAGLAASGTVTIEAAILGLPLVVVYRLNRLTLALARRVVTVSHFAMVNLVAGRVVFEEFLQDRVCPAYLAPAMESILPGGARRAEVMRGMEDVVRMLGGAVPASRRAARAILAEMDAADSAA